MNEKNYLQASLLAVAKELQKIQLIKECRQEYEHEMNSDKMDVDTNNNNNNENENKDTEAKQQEKEQIKNLELEVYDDKDYDIEEIRHLNFINKKNKQKPDIVRTLIYKVPDVQRLTRSSASILDSTSNNNIKITPVARGKASSSTDYGKNGEYDLNTLGAQTNETIVPATSGHKYSKSQSTTPSSGKKSTSGGTFKLTQTTNKTKKQEPEIVVEIDEQPQQHTKKSIRSTKQTKRELPTRKSKSKTTPKGGKNKSDLDDSGDDNSIDYDENIEINEEDDDYEIADKSTKRTKTTPKTLNKTKAKKSLQEDILNFIDEIDEKASKNVNTSATTSNKRKTIAVTTQEETDSNRSVVKTRRSAAASASSTTATTNLIDTTKDDIENRSETSEKSSITSTTQQQQQQQQKRRSTRLSKSTKDDNESVKSDSTENSTKGTTTRKSKSHLTSVSETTSVADDEIPTKKSKLSIKGDETTSNQEPERRLTRSKAKLLEKTNT